MESVTAIPARRMNEVEWQTRVTLRPATVSSTCSDGRIWSTRGSRRVCLERTIIS